ncbi:MAG: ABC transporter substrate-binding protein [Desulfurococcaceae archaeon]
MLDEMSKLVVFAALLLVALAALAQPTSAITVTDALGRSVSVPANPSRIVALSPSITEILAALGLSDRIIGCDSYSLKDWYMGLNGTLSSIGAKDLGGYWWSTLKVEEIIALHPDLVLADKGAQAPLAQTFSEYNLTVVYLNGGSSSSLNDVFNDIYVVGRIFNSTSQAMALVDKIEGEFRQYREALARYQGTRVLVVIGVYQGIWVAGKATFIDDALARLGITNAATVFGWGVMSYEDLVNARPDVIIVASMGISENDLKSAGIYNVGARVVVLNSTETDIFVRPGPLLQYFPEVLYVALSKAVANATLTSPAKGAEQTSPSASTAQSPAPASPAALSWTQAAAYVGVPALLVGAALGYALSRARRR